MVNAGNFAAPNRRIRSADLSIQRRKAELILDGLSVAPIPLTAMGIGERDLLMGGEWLMKALDDRHIPHVLSNVSCDGLEFVESRVHTVDGVSIEFLAFVSADFMNEDSTGDLRSVSSMLPQCTTLSPVDWFLEHPQQADLRVAFADLNRNDIGSLSPYVDIVIESKLGRTTAGPEALDARSVLIGVGSKGKNLGAVSWTYDANKSGFGSGSTKDGKLRDLDRRKVRLQNLKNDMKKASDPFEQNKLQRQIEYTEQSIERVESDLRAIPKVADSVMEISAQLVPLNRSIANFDAVESLIENAKVDIQQLEQEIAISDYEGPYVGSQACEGCHKTIYDSWGKTSHASAWQTLVEQSRDMDPSCFSCHSTGGGLENGPQRPSQVGHLKNVGCESCHGAGQEHVQTVSKDSIQKIVPDSVCTTCHNGIQDNGEFEPTSYRQRILHDK